MALVSPLFKWILISSAQASVLACLVLLAQALLRDRIHARWRWALWLLVVARMCLPWAPESPVSIFNLTPLRRGGAEIAVPTVGAVAPAGGIVAPAAPLRTVAAEAQTPAVTYTGRPATAGRTDMYGMLAVPWLLGVLSLSAAAVAQALLLSFRISREPRVADKSAASILDDCRRRMGVRARILLVETRFVKSPALFGLLRPKLLLPAGTVGRLTADQLRFVFLHELAHLKRRDIAVNLLMSALQFVHWFNPLVWYAFYRMRADRELACDALALSHAQPGEEGGYGKTLITLVEGLNRAPGLAMTVGIVESGSQLKRRIAMIAKFKPGSYRWTVPALVVFLALVAVALTNAQTPAPAKPQPAAKPAEPAVAPSGAYVPEAVAAEWSNLTPELREKLLARLAKLQLGPATLSETVNLLTKKAGIYIQIDPNRLPPEAKTVELHVTGSSIAAILDLVCRQVDRKWTARGGTVFISDDEGIKKWLSETAVDPDTREVRKKLQKRLPYFEFSGQPFATMIDFLRSTAVLNIVLDPNAPVQDKTITLQLSDATVESILNLMTVQVGVNWEIVKNFIYVSDNDGIRKLLSQGPKGFEADAETLEVEKKLQKRLPYFEFAGTPFTALIDFVRTTASLNIVVDSPAAPTADQTITLRLENAPVKSIIDLVTAQVGLNWTVRENFIYISDEQGIKNLASVGPASQAHAPKDIDVWIKPEDIHLVDGDYCRFISAAVHSSGRGTIPNVTVRFYLGDPDKGGKKIGEGGLSLEAGKTAAEMTPWDAAPGKYDIYAVVDPDNRIAETDETNNRAHATITIEAPFKLKEKAPGSK